MLQDVNGTLPEYDRPPLAEVVLGVQFQPIAGLGVVHYGRIYDAFRADFASWEEKPPIPPSFEAPDQQPGVNLSFRLLGEDVVHPRLWLMNEQRSRLVQVQSDRLLMNWRKVPEGGVYPRYEAIRESFREAFEKVRSTLSDSGLSRDVLEPNQVEVTYINHVGDLDGVEVVKSPHRVLRVFRAMNVEDEGSEEEDVQFVLRRALLASDGEWMGRLTMSVRPVQLGDGAKALAITLSAKGRPRNTSLASVLEFMDASRRKIALLFDQVVTEEAKAQWGRR